MSDEQIMPPVVTVLLAVYNGDRYLRPAVDSILAQTFTNFELLVIDDGSTDRTLQILRTYEQADRRVRIVTRPNRGLTNTLNEGLGLARGKYLARMDADDLCLPERFAKQVAFLDAHPDCVLLGSRVLVIDSEGMPIREMASETGHDEIDAAHLGRGWPVVHPAVMMRLDALKKIGGYRDEFNTLEDLDLFLRLAEVGKLANLPDVLLHYRQHFASVTHSREAKQIEIRQAIYDQTRTRRGLPPDVPPDARTTPRRRFEQHRLWAWTALKNGYVPTARKHALRTVRLAPFSIESWRVLFCAFRGR
jgi:glycosyltransferase involved in cell wall biosynthesis